MTASAFVDVVDTALRLAAATAAGAALGVNREWHGHDVGVRTLALVSLGSALITVATIQYGPFAGNVDALSRVTQGVIQGVMTGIGFLGAGAVLRSPNSTHVKGLTTAATVWITAALGVACALAQWPVVLVGAALTLAVLVLLHPLDKWIDARRRRAEDSAPPPLA